jgi:hypothetical protein
MKKITLAIALLIGGYAAQAQTYKIITTVESIVPGGMGRSRIVENTQAIDHKPLTTNRSDGDDDGKQRKVDRDDIKIDNMNETKILNFYSLMGINFQNIASNDAVITSKINDLVTQGWELAFVTSAVESDSGDKDGKGIFITRYIFKKK